VLKVVPVPNPQAGPVFAVDVLLSAFTGKIRGQLYSKAMVMLFQTELEGNWATGWNLLSWTIPELPNGTYYLRFDTGEGQRGRTGKLVVLR
jgi:hypothetical protein